MFSHKAWWYIDEDVEWQREKNYLYTYLLYGQFLYFLKNTLFTYFFGGTRP